MSGVTIKSLTFQTVPRLWQEVTSGKAAADPVQHGAGHAGVLDHLPGGFYSRGESRGVPGGGGAAALLHPGLLHVDADGGRASVPALRQGAGQRL